MIFLISLYHGYKINFWLGAVAFDEIKPYRFLSLFFSVENGLINIPLRS